MTDESFATRRVVIGAMSAGAASVTLPNAGKAAEQGRDIKVFKIRQVTGGQPPEKLPEFWLPPSRIAGRNRRSLAS